MGSDMSDSAVQLYTTRSGQMLSLKSDVYITRSLEVYGEYCPGEWLLLKQLIRPGMTVVEVGANIGAHSVDMARACAPGPFYAFEPQPRIFQILCANLALNDIGNALAYPEGCGETEGEAVVPPMNYAGRGNFGGVSLQPTEAPGVKVRVRPLDALDLATCGLLKIDVEGFEPQVLRGARETIARCRPVIYIENDREAQQQEVISLIAGMGYHLYWHTPGLFSADNFNGTQEDIFGRIGSLNMVCIPTERNLQVLQLTLIDPDNWTSPFRTSL
ncbi:MAG: FkbM family methyltransferase [Alphaproteobacteria bacterium]|nr:FkbM family methyltransferase [Alphaproteobacteria bacterium]MBU1516118.1 FkbM family methyltransferase [Alphaproteobacteria bacterium]MBU2092667.1 FkbM family methyltransferase [Alphaproteobacteria bacterium]MBU2153808.1 FkbM family methyltransferase [Alphaproteobacteria bacterium]MBU2308436.1 FkbM family methyltransferase [Alphaproteobacteria bacterium]